MASTTSQWLPVFFWFGDFNKMDRMPLCATYLMSLCIFCTNKCYYSWNKNLLEKNTLDGEPFTYVCKQYWVCLIYSCSIKLQHQQPGSKISGPVMACVVLILVWSSWKKTFVFLLSESRGQILLFKGHLVLSFFLYFLYSSLLMIINLKKDKIY